MTQPLGQWSLSYGMVVGVSDIVHECLAHSEWSMKSSYCWSCVAHPKSKVLQKSPWPPFFCLSHLLKPLHVNSSWTWVRRSWELGKRPHWKGIGFRSPNPEWRRWVPRGIQCDNATNLEKPAGARGRVLFSLWRAPWNGFTPERGLCLGELRGKENKKQNLCTWVTQLVLTHSRCWVLTQSHTLTVLSLCPSQETQVGQAARVCVLWLVAFTKDMQLLWGRVSWHCSHPSLKDTVLGFWSTESRLG